MKSKLQMALEICLAQREQFDSIDKKTGISFAIGVLQSYVEAEKRDLPTCGAGECVHCNDDYKCTKGFQRFDFDEERRCTDYVDRFDPNYEDKDDENYHRMVDERMEDAVLALRKPA